MNKRYSYTYKLALFFTLTIILGVGPALANQAEDRSIAFKRLGDTRTHAGDHAGAIKAYSRAIHLTPNATQIIKNRAEAKLRLGDREGAASDFRRAKEITLDAIFGPDFGMAYFGPMFFLLAFLFFMSRYQLGYDVAVKRFPPVLVGVICGTMAYPFSVYVLPEEYRDKIWMALQMAFALYMLFYLASCGRVKQKSGVILLSLGRVKGSSLHALFTGAGLLPPATHHLTRYFNEAPAELSDFTTGLFLLAMAFFFLSLNIGRAEIHERGIWFFIGLTGWDRIEGYEFEGKKHEVLTLRVKSKMPFDNRSSIRIPLEHKDEVRRLLNRFIPQE